MTRALYIFLTFIFILSGILGNAQLPGVKQFPLQGKIPGGKFTKIYNSTRGFIYCGTTAGLQKFNGSGFVPVCTEDTVTAVAEDGSGMLWLGFSNGKIARLQNSNLDYFNPEEGLSKKPVSSIAFDSKNNLWFSVAGEGIYYTAASHLYLINEENGLTDLNITVLYGAGDGNILASSDQGFFICNTGEKTKKVNNISPRNGLPDYIVTSFENMNGKSCFIGMQDKGFCIYNTGTGEIKVPVANWQWGEVTSLKYCNNILWAGTRENGLIKISNTESGHPQVQQVLSEANILCVLADAEENIWLATDNKLVKTYGSKISLLPLYTKPDYETIHAVIKTGNGTIWAGTNGGLIKYHLTNGLYQSQRIHIAGLNSMIDVTSLCEDPYGNIWVGSFGKGVYVLNPNTGAYRNITENPVMKNASILSVTSSGNTICAGGLEGAATIFELDENNREITGTYKFTNYNDKQNIGNNYIYTIFKDRKGRIWFGTNATGITMLQNGNFTNYNVQNGLDAKNVLSFTEDTNGGIWFCTEDNGVYKFDGKIFTHFTLQEGLSSLSNTNIKADKNGNIVIAHKEGLDIINTKTNRISYLNKNQGLPVISIDVGTVTTGSDGSILLTSEEGFINYQPPSQNAQPGPVTIIESVLLHLKPLPEKADNHFTYDENNITFNYLGIWNTNPELVQYQYKLEGYDSNWVATNDHSKSFAQLEPGTYTFRVRSSLNGNFNNATETSYGFVIERALWRRWWFITLCALLSVILMYWYMKGREKEIKKLQQLETEKTNFQFQVLRNQVNPHFLFNSFNTLISTIEENPKGAVDYVENLSDFFRNIVNYRDKDIISLKEELDVLENYVYLQKKRYGESLKVTVSPEVHAKSGCQIPPLTLQLLVENAVKHNAISADTPLTIDIALTDESLIITNNINSKMVYEKSSGMGLQNITKRYAMLSDKKIEVIKTDEFFSIKLPLLTN